MKMKNKYLRLVYVIVVSILVVLIAISIIFFESKRLFVYQANEWNIDDCVYNPENAAYILYFYSESCSACQKNLNNINQYITDQLPIYGIRYNPESWKTQIPSLVNKDQETNFFYLYNGSIGKTCLIDENGFLVKEKLRDITMEEFYSLSLEELEL